MKISLIMSCLLLFFTVNSEGGDERVSKDESKNVVKLLQGNWASIWSNTHSDKIDKKNYFSFKGNKVQIVYKEGIDPEKGRIIIIPSKTPETGGIDIIYTPTKRRAKSLTSKGIYILKENTLVLFIANAGEPRPKKISASLKTDENMWFLILVKEK